MSDYLVTDVVRDETTFALIANDNAKYKEFMTRYHQIKNQKDAEKQELENRFIELEKKVEANSILLKEIWNHLQSRDK